MHPFPHFLAFVATAFRSLVPKSLSVSQDCLWKLLQAEWLKTRGTYSLEWETRSEAERVKRSDGVRGWASSRGSAVWDHEFAVASTRYQELELQHSWCGPQMTPVPSTSLISYWNLSPYYSRA